MVDLTKPLMAIRVFLITEAISDKSGAAMVVRSQSCQMNGVFFNTEDGSTNSVGLTVVNVPNLEDDSYYVGLPKKTIIADVLKRLGIPYTIKNPRKDLAAEYGLSEGQLDELLDKAERL